jgi:two-component system sensor histidine kinase PilS (NtrC family)
MDKNHPTINPGWLLPLRLTTYIVVSGIIIFGLGYPAFLNRFFLVYSFLTLTLPLLYVFKKWFEAETLKKFLPFLQTLSEIIIIGCIIYTTGSINSAFSGIFILTIISAALVNKLAGTLSIASLISIYYSFIIWLGLGFADRPGASLKALDVIFASQDVAFYSIFLHILTFFMVAFISGFLVEKLKARDRQLADTSLALRQAKLETDDILRHLNSGLLTIDRAGYIVYFNRAGEEILGYNESEIKGKDFRVVFAGRMPQLIEQLQDSLFSQKQTQRSEIEIINKNAEPVPIGLSTSLLIDEDDDMRGVIAIFQDLRETKKLEEKIRAADTMAAVGELSAAIAHEIRNPLAAISGSVEVLNSELKLAAENRRLMELIVRESSRLNNILSDFLTYARSHRSSYNKVELCRLISDVIEVIRHHPAYRPGISLRLLARESCIYVFGDENQLKQILMNLIVNSCHAINEDSGDITVSLETDGDGRVIMKAIDSGSGIDEKELPRIFNPFYSTKKDGTGLGLAIVQRLSSIMDIDLSVVSQKDVGTSFVLRFNQVPRENADLPDPAVSSAV